MQYKNVIIYLLGYPGTGKYTIGKEICAIAPAFRLVDNHLINNTVFTLIHTDGKTKLPSRVWDNVSKIWDAVIDTMIHVSPSDYNFILTNALFHTEEEVAWFNEVANMAKARKATFVPVLLTISVAEHKKRIATMERSQRLKETDPESPERYGAANNIIRLNHPNLLTLDVSTLTAQQAANVILTHAQKMTAC